LSARPFTGWRLNPDDRAALLQRFPPRYANVVADHVTLAFRPAHPKLPTETAGEIVGEADDGAGVQALVVRIGGTTDRPDGSTYHLTWSLAEGRRGRESNDVLRDRGWTPHARPTPVRLEPRLFAAG
jgi:hypothetical protein